MFRNGRGAKPASDMAESARILELAKQTADQAVADAKEEAARIIARAREEAEQIIAEARARAQQM